jgi:seryl-tRNA synthetase
MLDISFIRAHREKVEDSAAKKGYHINLDDLLALDDERKSLLKVVESNRQERNEVAAKMKNGKPDPELIA